ncbi:histone-lysine N-methyltransferase PRDM9-like [Brienomyrus brachyistius]|uniref:histone-lysine N-methyltransferase PRDM9-like n=1 Tax=Brienomyrus brachyistius TaxID=42636 RepID=UPI0020B2A455|nr:histone-lysine N-methyltransferase PRDM9-like [Brienomyrus brachyistius]
MNQKPDESVREVKKEEPEYLMSVGVGATKDSPPEMKSAVFQKVTEEKLTGSLLLKSTDGNQGMSESLQCEHTMNINSRSCGRSLNSTPKILYTEGVESKDDDYLHEWFTVEGYCEDFQSSFTDQCEVHGPPVFIPDSPALVGVPGRALLTLPPGLEVSPSSIPGAGQGVFSQGQTVPRGVHFRPYEEDTGKEEAIDSGYSWVVYKGKWCETYIDARRETHSNWMRYVNCARDEEEQNLVAFQHKGNILYRCCKPIAPGQELLVWYAEDHAKDLGITFDCLWSKKCYSQGISDKSTQGFPCSQCSLSFTAEIYLHGHMKRSHPEEFVRQLMARSVNTSQNFPSSAGPSASQPRTDTFSTLNEAAAEPKPGSTERLSGSFSAHWGAGSREAGAGLPQTMEQQGNRSGPATGPNKPQTPDVRRQPRADRKLQ